MGRQPDVDDQLAVLRYGQEAKKEMRHQKPSDSTFGGASGDQLA